MRTGEMVKEKKVIWRRRGQLIFAMCVVLQISFEKFRPEPAQALLGKPASNLFPAGRQEPSLLGGGGERPRWPFFFGPEKNDEKRSCTSVMGEILIWLLLNV